jgi:flagellar L-ring protein FlgH
MNQFVKISPLIFLLCACSAQTKKLLDQPQLSTVGIESSDSLTTSTITDSFEEYSDKEDKDEKSNWIGGSADFFRDSRPRGKGDLIIVNIAVNDSATFNNSSAQSRKSANSAGTDFDIGLFNLMAKGQGEAKINGNAAASGQGSVVRSEKLKLQLTAVVQRVLPNGYFVIEGTQQVLVNNEMRDVRVAGIVNPNDVAPDNSVDYHKIAEARAHYGGTGTVSAVQKPAWGVQLWDKIAPF